MPQTIAGAPANTTRPNTWTALWQSVVRFQKGKITPWLALRNTLGVVIPLSAGVAFGNPQIGLALATGALNVSYSDSHEPYIVRTRKMLAASILVALAVFSGALCGHDNILAILIAATWAFAAGTLVALSTTAADLGSISLVTLIVYSAVPQTPDRAVYAGLLALAGGLFQTLLSIAMWPVRRYSPERKALGDLFLALSQMAASPVQVLEAPPATQPFTQAQTTLASLDQDRSIEGQRYRMQFSEAERMRLSLLLLGRLRIRIQREIPGGFESNTLDTYLSACSRLLLAIGHALISGENLIPVSGRLDGLERLADDLRNSTRESATAQALINEARVQMDALNGQLRTTVELVSNATPEGLEAFARTEISKPWRLRFGGVLATLRANFSLASTALRHAVRLAVCVAIGDALARGTGFRRPYWLPMTIAIVLKPDFSATFSRGVLRLIGTLAGLLLATALFHLLHPAMAAQIVLIGALMYAMRCWGPANYGVFVTMVTGLVVVLIALAGVSPKDVMLARGINTLIGGVIALLAYWLWPTWERTQVPEALARMLDAYRNYFREVREAYLHPDQSYDADLDRTRAEGRRTRTNLEASIERLSAEPGTSPEVVRSLSSILASSNRLVHAFMALEAGLSTSHPVPARSGFRPFANDVELTLYYLASALRGSAAPTEVLPDLREAHYRLVHSSPAQTDRYTLVNVETDRVTNSLNTLSQELLNLLPRLT